MTFRVEGEKKALHLEDTTAEELEETREKVVKLLNYLLDYDGSCVEKFSEVKNPVGALVLFESDIKHERGSLTEIHMMAVGQFTPQSVAKVIRDFLIGSVREAMMGREVE